MSHIQTKSLWGMGAKIIAVVCLVAWCCLGGLARGANVQVYEPLQGASPQTASALALTQALDTLGVGYDWISEAAVGAGATSDPARQLILLNGQSISVAGQAYVEQHVSSGGDLLVIGGIPGQTILQKANDKYIERREFLNAAKSIGTLVDWSAQDMTGWTLDKPGTLDDRACSLAAVQEEGETFARLQINQISDYTLAVSPELKKGFSKDAALCIVQARAQGPLTTLHFELNDTGGGRWYAKVPLSSQWTRHTLERCDFSLMNAPKDVAKSLVDLSKISSVRAGVARVGLTAAQGGTQTIDLKNIEFATLDKSYQRTSITSANVTEAVGSSQTIYSFTPAAGAYASSLHALGTQGSLPYTGATVWARAKRPRALNGDASNGGRWIAWVSLTEPASQALPDAVVSSWIEQRTAGQWPVWSHLGLDLSRVSASALTDFLRPPVALSQGGLLVLSGGLDSFCVAPGDPLSWTCRVVNRNSSAAAASLTVIVESADGVTQWSSGSQSLSLAAGEQATAQGTAAAAPTAAVEGRLRLELRNAANELLDVQLHRFTIEQPQSADTSEIVTTAQGRFMLDGQRWYPHGVHYWLPFVAGQEDQGRNWHSWLTRAIYDPAIVEHDLAMLAQMGFAAVVAPYRSVDEASCVKDFLTRCARHNLKGMLYIENAHPLTYNLSTLAQMIEAADLGRQRALFALDLAWEPHLGPRAQRQWLDTAWTQWVQLQYGSLEQAQTQWGWNGAVSSGVLEGPSDAQITTDGDWRVMVAAYRRFLDDHISAGFGAVARTIHATCPDVLLGVRSGYGGTGASWIDYAMPFDLTAGADHLDYISPEAYGLSGAWSGFLDGKLISAFSRMVGRQVKPVVWMEYGQSAIAVGSDDWDQNSPDQAMQAAYFSNMIRLMQENQDDSSFAWWWAPGYRVDEKSDYGLTDLRGAPRTALSLFAQSQSALSCDAVWTQPTQMIEADRDLHPRGLSQMIARHRSEFLALVDAGQSVGFKQYGDGLDTATVALKGVGNITAGANMLTNAGWDAQTGSVTLGDDEAATFDNGATLTDWQMYCLGGTPAGSATFSAQAAADAISAPNVLVYTKHAASGDCAVRKDIAMSTIEPGEDYTFGLWLRDTQGGATPLSLYVGLFDESNQFLGALGEVTATATAQWARVQQTFTAPATARYASFQVRIAADMGQVQLDSAWLRPAAAAGGPLKGINAEFDGVDYLDKLGNWVELEAGQRISLESAASPVQLRAGLLNTGVCAWAAGQAAPGGVYLGAARAGQDVAAQYLQNVVAGGARQTVALTLEGAVAGDYSLRCASARTGAFGEVFSFTVVATDEGLSLFSNPGWDEAAGTVTLGDGEAATFDNGATLPGWQAYAFGGTPAGSSTFTAMASGQAVSSPNLLVFTKSSATADSALRKDPFPVSVTAGNVYKYGLWLRDTDGSLNSLAYALMIFPGGTVAAGGATLPATTQWQKIEKVFSVPEGQSSVSLNLRLGEATGSLWLDSSFVYDVTLGNRVTNPGFENSSAAVTEWSAFSAGGRAVSLGLSPLAASGQRALRLSQTSGVGDGGVERGQNLIPWSGPQGFVLSFKVKDDPTVGQGETLSAEVSALDAQGALAGSPVTVLFETNSNEYSQYQLSAAQVDASARWLNIRFRICDHLGQGVAGDLLIDDVDLRVGGGDVSTQTRAKHSDLYTG